MRTVLAPNKSAPALSDIEQFEQIDTLYARLSSTQKTPFVIVSVGDMDSNALVVRKLSQANPQAKFICITTSIEDRQGLMSENAYVVYRFPVLQSELLRAFHVLSGCAPQVDTSTETRLVSHNGKTNKILVAEDNNINRMVIGAQLEKLGYDVTFAEDGLIGLEKWEKLSLLRFWLMVKCPIWMGIRWSLNFGNENAITVCINVASSSVLRQMHCVAMIRYVLMLEWTIIWQNQLRWKHYSPNWTNGLSPRLNNIWFICLSDDCLHSLYYNRNTGLAGA